MKPNHEIRIKVTKAQFDKIKKQADKVGLKPAVFGRLVLLSIKNPLKMD